MCTWDTYVHTGNIGRKLGQESKGWNSLWSSNLLDTLRPIFSLKGGKKKSGDFVKSICPI